MSLSDWLSLAGTVVFAWTGVLAGYRKQVDLFGAIVLGVVTAVGGGTLRDLLIGATPAFWLRTPEFLVTAIAASVIAFVASSWRRQTEAILKYADAFGLALFTVLGTEIAISHGLSLPVVMILGMITGCFGGLVRDVMTNRVPYIFTSELYATASLVGATVCWFFRNYEDSALIVGACVVFAIRYGSIRFGWRLPTFGEVEKRGRGVKR